MRCKKANRLMSEKLDGMLSPRKNAALRATVTAIAIQSAAGAA